MGFDSDRRSFVAVGVEVGTVSKFLEFVMLLVKCHRTSVFICG